MFFGYPVKFCTIALTRFCYGADVKFVLLYVQKFCNLVLRKITVTASFRYSKMCVLAPLANFRRTTNSSQLRDKQIQNGAPKKTWIDENWYYVRGSFEVLNHSLGVNIFFYHFFTGPLECLIIFCDQHYFLAIAQHGRRTSVFWRQKKIALNILKIGMWGSLGVIMVWCNGLEIRNSTVQAPILRVVRVD